MKRRFAPAILVAVADPSAPLEAVMLRAAQLGAAWGARLLLFHAAFDSSLSGGRLFNTRKLAQARGACVAERARELDRHAAALRRRGLEVDVRVVWEEPAHEAIIRAAVREHAAMVVAGPHRLRPNRTFSLRLTDWELMRLCPRPLLLAQPTSQHEQGVVLAALDPTHAHDKPATLDEALAQHGATLAQALGAPLHIVHCVPRGAYALDENTPEHRRRMRERMHRKLEKLLKRAGVSPHKVHVLQGSVEEQVPKLVQRLSAQALVMGALSRRGLQRFVVGDTAESLIRDAPCDLLIIKPEHFRLRLGRSRKEAIETR